MKINKSAIICDACGKEITDNMTRYTVIMYFGKNFSSAINTGVETHSCSRECLETVKRERIY